MRGTAPASGPHIVMHELAAGVWVSTSRTMQTNSTILVGETEAFLIDPAWHDDELDAIADFLVERGLTVVGGLATHPHHDHLLWSDRFGTAPRWASERTVRLAETEREALLEGLGERASARTRALMGRVAPTASLTEAMLPPGIIAELIVHDAHAPGHTAVWLPRQRVLIAGDMLSDVELPLPFDPDDVPAYVRGLAALEPYAQRAALIIPGHGSVGADASARLEADRRYLRDVITRGMSTDVRIAQPGMAGEYARLQRLVQETGPSAELT